MKKGRTLRVEPVGFLGTAERPCLKTSDSRQSLSAPGPSPAQYNPGYYTMEVSECGVRSEATKRCEYLQDMAPAS